MRYARAPHLRPGMVLLRTEAAAGVPSPLVPFEVPDFHHAQARSRMDVVSKPALYVDHVIEPANECIDAVAVELLPR